MLLSLKNSGSSWSQLSLCFPPHRTRSTPTMPPKRTQKRPAKAASYRARTKPKVAANAAPPPTQAPTAPVPPPAPALVPGPSQRATRSMVKAQPALLVGPAPDPPARKRRRRADQDAAATNDEVDDREPRPKKRRRGPEADVAEASTPAPRSPVLFSDFPDELLEMVSAELNTSDIFHIAACCKRLFGIAIPLMYARIVISLPQWKSELLLIQLNRRPDLAARVRVFDAIKACTVSRPLHNLLYAALRHMHALEVLSLPKDIDDNVLDSFHPRLRLLKTRAPAPLRFIARHPAVSALDLSFDTTNVRTADALGDGAPLRHLRCNQYAAYTVLEGTRALAPDAVLELQVYRPQQNGGSEDAMQLLEALAATPHPPAVVAIDRFVLEQVAEAACDDDPPTNAIPHLRVHISASPREVSLLHLRERSSGTDACAGEDVSSAGVLPVSRIHGPQDARAQRHHPAPGPRRPLAHAGILPGGAEAVSYD